MKFILWTLVFFLVNILSTFVNEYLLQKVYSDNVQGLSSVTNLFLWIFLYYKIIVKEK